MVLPLVDYNSVPLVRERFRIHDTVPCNLMKPNQNNDDVGFYLLYFRAEVAFEAIKTLCDNRQSQGSYALKAACRPNDVRSILLIVGC